MEVIFTNVKALLYVFFVLSKRKIYRFQILYFFNFRLDNLLVTAFNY